MSFKEEVSGFLEPNFICMVVAKNRVNEFIEMREGIKPENLNNEQIKERVNE